MSKRDRKNLYEEAVQRGVYADGKLVSVKCPRCHQWAGPSSSTFYRNHGRTKCEEKQDPQHLEGGLCRLCGHHVRACSMLHWRRKGLTHMPALAVSSCCLGWSRAPHACIRLNTCCAHACTKLQPLCTTVYPATEFMHAPTNPPSHFGASQANMRMPRCRIT